MANGRFRLTFMSLEDGHEWHRYYDTYEEVSRAYERALSSSFWQNLDGAFDPDGRRVKTIFELKREKDDSERKEKQRLQNEADRIRQAELDADPVERAVSGAMKWFWIAMAVLFVMAMLGVKL